MTAPRQVIAGATALVTRRCSERRLFLRPSRVTNEIFLYVLAVAAQRYGIRVHAFCVLSNHYHLLVTDPEARLPEFEQYLDSLVARAVNASQGRFEGFWASGTSYSAVAPEAPEDVVAKAAYVLANPVAAGLVSTGVEWPGLRSSPDQVGADKIVARRPKVFFREGGDMPASVELELTPPSGFTAEDFRGRLREAVEGLEKKARRELAAAGRSFLGCPYRPSRSRVPADADHPYRSRTIAPERDDAGWFYFAGFWPFVKSPFAFRIDSPPSFTR